MITSFAFIFDNNNNYNKLLIASEKYFDLKLIKPTRKNANGIDRKNEFFITISPSKIQFIVTAEENVQTVEIIKKFMSEQFNNQILGLQYIEGEKPSFDLKNVKTVAVY